MQKRIEVSEIRGQSAEGSGERKPARAERPWLAAFVAVAVVLATAVGVALLAGCGSHDDSSTQAASSGVTASPDASQPVQAAAAAATPAPAQGGLSIGDVAVREGLPPDFTVSASDTLVTPGQEVGFIVRGTEDVVEVALSDGRDDPMPFVRDADSDTWRLRYRAPLHPRHERFGVSITAKNDLNRWRRSWVFLHVNTGDSTKTDEAPVDNPDELKDGN
jgi:hypothetical protein